MKAYVVYATRIGEPDYMADCITDTTDRVKRDNAIAWAKSQGFDRVRVKEYDDSIFEKPDFIGTINV